MTLVTTPGAVNADSYASLAEADAYFTARGNTVWTGTDAAKENALRRAATYLDNAYRARWIGIRATQAQARGWPRVEGQRERFRVTLTYALLDIDGFEIAVDSVPVQLKNAQIEVALLALTGEDLEPIVTPQVQSESKSVGPLSKSVTYTGGAAAFNRYTAIEGWLRGLVTSTPGASSGAVQMVRG
jgi:hypothetical protein